MIVPHRKSSRAIFSDICVILIRIIQPLEQLTEQQNPVLVSRQWVLWGLNLSSNPLSPLSWLVLSLFMVLLLLSLLHRRWQSICLYLSEYFVRRCGTTRKYLATDSFIMIYNFWDVTNALHACLKAKRSAVGLLKENRKNKATKAVCINILPCANLTAVSYCKNWNRKKIIIMQTKTWYKVDCSTVIDFMYR